MNKYTNYNIEIIENHIRALLNPWDWPRVGKSALM